MEDIEKARKGIKNTTTKTIPANDDFQRFLDKWSKDLRSSPDFRTIKVFFRETAERWKIPFHVDNGNKNKNNKYFQPVFLHDVKQKILKIIAQ